MLIYKMIFYANSATDNHLKCFLLKCPAFKVAFTWAKFTAMLPAKMS
jgi:hypothetical protein